MVIHSGSLSLLLAYLVALGVVIALLASIVLLIARKIRPARNVFLASVAAVGLYIVAATAVSLLAHSRVINVGDSYCWDLWCMGIEKVHTNARGQENEYRIDVRIFSDANTVKTSAGDASIYLLDDRGRRFPVVNDPAVVPYTTPLIPGQTIKTTLTFVAPMDAGHLFLTGDAPLPAHFPLGWRVGRYFADLHFGYEKLLHKPTLLRVL